MHASQDLAPWARARSLTSWKASQALTDELRPGFSDRGPLNSTPKSVVTPMAVDKSEGCVKDKDFLPGVWDTAC